MTIRQFLDRLQASDIKVWAEGDRLRCSAPQGLLTPELQAELARRKMEVLAFLRAGSTTRSSLVPIQPKGSRLPFFGVPGHNGDVFCFVRLAHHLGDDQPFYAFQPPGFDGERPPFHTVPDLAAHYVRELQKFLPGGPYLLGGYCAGGSVAFEVARQLRIQGEEVGLISLFGAPFPSVYLFHNQLWNMCRYLLHRIPRHLRAVASTDWWAALRYLWERMQGFTREAVKATRNTLPRDYESNYKATVANATLGAIRGYRPIDYPGPVHLFAASETTLKPDYGFQRKWGTVARGGLHIQVGPEECVGANMLREPYVEYFAERLRALLDSRGEGDKRRIDDDAVRDKSPLGSH